MDLTSSVLVGPVLEHLRKSGREASFFGGEKVDEDSLNAAESEMPFPIPTSLRKLYQELSEGFSIHGTEFQLPWLDDLVGMNTEFHLEVEQSASHNGSACPPEELQKEVLRRSQWMPFLMIDQGDFYICVDHSTPDLPVVLYQTSHWPLSPASWDLILASSAGEFVEKWSRYCYGEPTRGWGAIPLACSGRFSWDASWFPEHAKRE